MTSRRWERHRFHIPLVNNEASRTDERVAASIHGLSPWPWLRSSGRRTATKYRQRPSRAYHATLSVGPNWDTRRVARLLHRMSASGTGRKPTTDQRRNVPARDMIFFLTASAAAHAALGPPFFRFALMITTRPLLHLNAASISARCSSEAPSACESSFACACVDSWLPMSPGAITTAARYSAAASGNFACSSCNSAAVAVIQ